MSILAITAIALDGFDKAVWALADDADEEFLAFCLN